MDKRIIDLPEASTLGDSDVLVIYQSSATKKLPGSKIKEKIQDEASAIVEEELEGYLPLTGGELTGDFDLNTGGDAYNLDHVVRLRGRQGTLQLFNYDKVRQLYSDVVVSNVADPTNEKEAANKRYVDNAVAGLDGTIYYHYDHATHTADFELQDVFANLGKRQVVIATSGNSDFYCELKRYNDTANMAWFDCITYDDGEGDAWFVNVTVTQDGVSYTEGTISVTRS